MSRLSFTEASERYQIIEKPHYKKTLEEKELTDAYYFYLKCWDNMAPNLGEGKDCISLLSRFFPTDQACRDYFPMGNFKALEGLSHETIYSIWMTRFFDTTLIDHKGNPSTISKFIGHYMMKKYKEIEGHEFSRDIVRQAICLNLHRAAKGMSLEHWVHEQQLEEWRNHPRLEYKVATPEMEHKDIDSLLVWRDSGEIVRKYSVKNLRALRDETILKKRYGMKDGKEKLEPTHYMGVETVDSTKIIVKSADLFPRPENLDELRKKWQKRYSQRF